MDKENLENDIINETINDTDVVVTDVDTSNESDVLSSDVDETIVDDTADDTKDDTNEEIAKQIQRERSRAKNEILKELGITSIKDGLERLNRQAETIEVIKEVDKEVVKPLEDYDEYKTLSESFKAKEVELQELRNRVIKDKYGINPDMEHEFETIVKGKIDNEGLTYEDATISVLEKLPNFSIKENRRVAINNVTKSKESINSMYSEAFLERHPEFRNLK